jgi:hypothetical protein
MNWNHIIFVDLLPIVTFGLIGYIYHRMKVAKLERENKSLSSDVDFWQGYSERTAEAYDRIFAAYEKLKAVKPENPASNAQVLPPAGVARLISDLESKDFENILNRQDEPAQNLPDQ